MIINVNKDFHFNANNLNSIKREGYAIEITLNNGSHRVVYDNDEECVRNYDLLLQSVYFAFKRPIKFEREMLG